VTLATVVCAVHGFSRLVLCNFGNERMEQNVVPAILDDATVEAEQASLILGTHQAVELAEAPLSATILQTLLTVLARSLKSVEHLSSLVMETT
jgi:hypothetical protein